ncbi:MAG TPA: cytochrome c peroxidase [Gemmatimonas sp.]|uniref:cytochrome c peroxidase n=1 Tax=Gemmatimonas sp. TaxID=1962908 RepID=UPI002ED8E41E
MKTLRWTIGTIVTFAGLAACSPANGDGQGTMAAAARAAHDAGDARAMQVRALWVAQLDTLDRRLAVLDTAVRAYAAAPRDSNAHTHARARFAEARQSFKRAELAIEYYTPSAGRELNGPALPEVEDGEGPEVVLEPTGFQVVEEMLFDDEADEVPPALVQETSTLRVIASRAGTMLGAQAVTDDRVWDAATLEMARIVSLGMAGFDSPVAGLSLSEASAALEGIATTLAVYRAPDASWQALDSLVNGARAALNTTTSRDAFDHFDFIVRHANPIAREIRARRVALGIGAPTERRAFRLEAATLFDSAAFDVLAFAPVDAEPGTPAQEHVGEQLFADPRLSGDGKRACTSCHLSANGFTDGMRVNRTRGGAPLLRNTPTVLNSALQVGAFTDLRVTYLEDQITTVIENVDEMHGHLDESARLLTADTTLRRTLQEAFRGTRLASDSAVTGAQVRHALATYLRSLTAMNSPVDRALRGDTAAINAEQRAGFNVFVGKGKCATCHFLPLTNGTVPPMYQKTEVEVLGVPTAPVTTHGRIDPDEGRFRITRSAPHRYAFRTPTVRNVALTAPYMHNGVYRTLESVVDFYNRGGGAGIGITLEYQTLPADTLGLTAQEQRQLVVFLRALTDTSRVGRR